MVKRKIFASCSHPVEHILKRLKEGYKKESNVRLVRFEGLNMIDLKVVVRLSAARYLNNTNLTV